MENIRSFAYSFLLWLLFCSWILDLVSFNFCQAALINGDEENYLSVDSYDNDDYRNTIDGGVNDYTMTTPPVQALSFSRKPPADQSITRYNHVQNNPHISLIHPQCHPFPQTKPDSPAPPANLDRMATIKLHLSQIRLSQLPLIVTNAEEWTTGFGNVPYLIKHPKQYDLLPLGSLQQVEFCYKIPNSMPSLLGRWKLDGVWGRRNKKRKVSLHIWKISQQFGGGFDINHVSLVKLWTRSNYHIRTQSSTGVSNSGKDDEEDDLFSLEAFKKYKSSTLFKSSKPQKTKPLFNWKQPRTKGKHLIIPTPIKITEVSSTAHLPVSTYKHHCPNTVNIMGLSNTGTSKKLLQTVWMCHSGVFEVDSRWGVGEFVYSFENIAYKPKSKVIKRFHWKTDGHMFGPSTFYIRK